MAIVPGMTDLTRGYWEAAREGRLVVQECRACGRIRHPPLPACPACRCADSGWREVSGDGTVYSCTIVRHPTHAALADAVPYVIAIVALAEGPRIVSGVTGCPPEAVTVGMPVRVAFRWVTDEVALPFFESALRWQGDAPRSRGGVSPMTGGNGWDDRLGPLERIRQRIDELRRRTEELAERGRELMEEMEDGERARGSSADQVERAAEHAERARDRADAASARSTAAYLRSAAAHDAAAQRHERLASGGFGDADEHRRRAREHREMSTVDRVAGTDDAPHPPSGQV